MNEKEFEEILASLKGAPSEEMIEKLLAYKRKNPSFEPSAEMTAQMNAITAAWQNDPKYKKMLEDIAKKQKSQKIAQNVDPFIKSVLAGSDIATSLNQIRSAKKTGVGLRRPVRPTFRQSDELRAAVDDARSRANSVDPNVINTAKLANLDAYTADLNAAKTASTGQAGLYGSLAQAAINRRYRNNAGLAPEMQRMLMQNRSRYDGLLGQQQSEQSRLNQLEGMLYGQDLHQYNNEARAIGALEARGRGNLRNSLYNTGQIAPGVLGQMSTMQPPVDNLGNIFKRESLQDWVTRTGSDYNATPRYKPDTYELGEQNQPYLDALNQSTINNLYNNVPSHWGYRPGVQLS